MSKRVDKPRSSWEGYWTEEERAYVRDHYLSMSDEEMAEHLGRTTKQVRSHRTYIGLLRKKPNQVWTDEERAYLEDNWGIVPASSIASHLNRTLGAVEAQAKTMQLGRQTGLDEMMNKEQITKLMGLSCRETVNRWVSKGLKMRKLKLSTGGDSRHKTWVIRFSSLLKFLEEHPEEWDSRRVPLYGLGVEYDWLKKKREEDSKRNPLPRKWTEEELSLLKMRVARKDSYSSIASDLQRDIKAVRAMAFKKGYCVIHTRRKKENEKV